MKSTKYAVVFELFTERHFIKSFAKKYRGLWDSTLRGLIVEFSFFDLLFLRNTTETVIDAGDVKICKTEFRIAGPGKSRHTSGNRCIVAVKKSTATVHVLPVYCKGDIGEVNETVKWKEIIKENYPEYKDLI